MPLSGVTCGCSMSYLKRFFKNVLREESFSLMGSELDRIPKLEIESHMTTAHYGSFCLTEAIRPSFDLRIVPEQGYRHDHYRDEQTGCSMPVLMVAVSSEQLFDTFLDLLDPLGFQVDVVLETSHRRALGGHADLYREQIDLPILKSFLYEFEDMLLNDGCTGVAVLNPAIPIEVQFDEHKMLIIYAEDTRPFEKILQQRSIPRNNSLRILTEAEHVHTSRDEYYRMFLELQSTLGIDEECSIIP